LKLRVTMLESWSASRWGNITEFESFDLITPNEREARFALADQDSNIVTLSFNLMQASRCQTLILKLGSRGVALANPSKEDMQDLGSFIVLDSFANNVVDAVGAGDALLAYSTLAKVCGGHDVTATILGSMAAACECEVDGNIPVRPEHVLARIDAVERQSHIN